MKKRPGWSIYKTNWNNLMNSILIPNYEERYEKKNIVLAGKRGQKRLSDFIIFGQSDIIFFQMTD